MAEHLRPLSSYPTPVTAQLRAGGRATLVGLEARAELNGREVVVHQFDSERAKWIVRIIPSVLRGEVKALPALRFVFAVREGNLKPLSVAAARPFCGTLTPSSVSARGTL